MFGGRYPDEEGVYAYKSWVHCLIQRNAGVDEVYLRKDGGLVRVPTHDNVPVVVPRRRMIVPVHPITLQPLDGTERRLGHPAIRQDEERDTTIVYIPPFFKIRITIFLLFIWTTGSILFCSISVVPCKLIKSKRSSLPFVNY
jgi:E3 ubiquitin-protein ligase DOA10